MVGSDVVDDESCVEEALVGLVEIGVEEEEDPVVGSGEGEEDVTDEVEEAVIERLLELDELDADPAVDESELIDPGEELVDVGDVSEPPELDEIPPPPPRVPWGADVAAMRARVSQFCAILYICFTS